MYLLALPWFHAAALELELIHLYHTAMPPRSPHRARCTSTQPPWHPHSQYLIHGQCKYHNIQSILIHIILVYRFLRSSYAGSPLFKWDSRYNLTSCSIISILTPGEVTSGAVACNVSLWNLCSTRASDSATFGRHKEFWNECSKLHVGSSLLSCYDFHHDLISSARWISQPEHINRCFLGFQNTLYTFP